MNAKVHLLIGDVPEELLEVEAGHDDQPRPRVQRGVEQHRHAVDVEEGQHRQDAVVGAHPLDGPDLCDVGGEVAVGEHHALGVGRRARAVGQAARCVAGSNVDVRAGKPGREQVGRVGVTVYGVARPVEHDHARRRSARPRRGGLEGLRQQRRDGDEHLGLRVGQLLGDVLGGEERVDGRGRGAGAQDAVERDREGRTVGGQQPDDVADADAALRRARPRTRRSRRSCRGRWSRCRYLASTNATRSASSSASSPNR